MDSPIISIITITLNSQQFIETTIQSVIKQNYTKIEYIIIDGVSTDSTLDIIKKHSSQIDYFLSEPDNGIADAMNKGLKVAKGDYILFLHSDDYLVDENALENASHFLDSDHDIFLFNIFYCDNGRKTLIKPRGLNCWINFKTGVLHQGTICSRNLFKKIGDFDTRLKIAMDYDFFLRAYKNDIKSKIINFPLSVMRTTGISFKKDWPSLNERFSDERQVHKKNCDSLIKAIMYKMFWLLYPPYKYMVYRLCK